MTMMMTSPIITRTTNNVADTAADMIITESTPPSPVSAGETYTWHGIISSIYTVHE